jgi:CheY-like chemotaxis protein
MRILIIDDTFEAKMAIADVLGDAHDVAHAYDPDVLPGLLATAEPFDLALVDMVFTGSKRSGLGALRILREQPDGARPLALIRCSDDEANRQLHLLAAFTLFDPLALVSRREDPRALGPMVDAIERGERITGGADRYRHHGPLPAALDELLRNPTDLAIWQALTRFDKRPDIARAAFVSASAVDHFIGEMSPLVEKLQDRFGDSGGAADGREHAHDAPLIRLVHFARLHKDFFRDPDLGPLLEKRWQERHRKISEASKGVLRERRRGRRRRGQAE